MNTADSIQNTIELHTEPVDKEQVKSRILTIRGKRVMLDRDIAEFFEVETGALNRAMKRNIARFPESFCFQLSPDEASRCQIGILNTGRGSNLKYLPYAYTEQGTQRLRSMFKGDYAVWHGKMLISGDLGGSGIHGAA